MLSAYPAVITLGSHICQISHLSVLFRSTSTFFFRVSLIEIIVVFVVIVVLVVVSIVVIIIVVVIITVIMFMLGDWQDLAPGK